MKLSCRRTSNLQPNRLAVLSSQSAKADQHSKRPETAVLHHFIEIGGQCQVTDPEGHYTALQMTDFKDTCSWSHEHEAVAYHHEHHNRRCSGQLS